MSEPLPPLSKYDYSGQLTSSDIGASNVHLLSDNGGGTGEEAHADEHEEESVDTREHHLGD